MQSRFLANIKRAALSAPAFLRHVPELEKERDGLKAHAQRLEMECRLLDEHVANLERERDELKPHIRRLERLDRLLHAEPGTYGSPIVDPELPETQRAARMQQRWEWQGAPLALDEGAMVDLFHRLRRHYPEVPFPEAKTPDWRYYLGNPAFSYADGITLFCMLREFRPARIVEAGVGFSSCLMMDTNDRFFGGAIEMRMLDPHPEVLRALLEPGDPYLGRIQTLALQDASLDLFTSLGEGDLLFIDSSHVGKTASDVTDYCFRILPALKPGVLVHVHDIFYPFEYPPEWVIQENRSWNEAYLLRAFLQYNQEFKVIYFNDWIYNRHADLTGQHMPLCRRQTGGSIWLRRRGSSPARAEARPPV
jgi:hypothetical protein